jgi:UDP-2,3-diacylglucosamine pyrophosphatase LpxH
MQKRHVDVVVISDVHLGTYGCHATELNKYLKTIKPSILILNGDIIDGWQFRKSYFPDEHMKVVRRIMKLMMQGTQIYYLTGNHDEILRRFSDMEAGNFQLRDKLLLEIDGKKVWFFHGDVFDVTMRFSKVIAKLGGFGYDLLIRINSLVNFISQSLGRGKISLSKRIKDSVKSAIKFVSDFEITATDLAIENGYDYVVCGHIHRPNIQKFSTEKGSVVYMNSGDWIENLTSLEYHNGDWSIFKYNSNDFLNIDELFPELPDTVEIDVKEVVTREFLFNMKSR